MAKQPYEPVLPERPEDINFLDVSVQNCPYPAYQLLRDEAPVWRDPLTGFFVITRFKDLRDVLLDTETFSSSNYGGGTATVHTDRARRMRAIYEDTGWLPAPTLAGRDDPNHKQMREMFNEAFRPSIINKMDSFVEETACKLVDHFINDGSCDWVQQLAVPLPLIVIGRQMGVPEEDIWQIKDWTNAWVQRLGMMQTEEEEAWSIEMEVQAQHYFQPVFERLRLAPDDTLLSEMVNRVIPEWGRPLNNNELHAEMMADTFVGGSETTTNALAFGVMLLIRNPESWEMLKSDPDRYLKTFIEEVVRLECPVQGLFRYVAEDTELHGVKIPKGSMINTRYAAANRDEREFDCPAQLDLERKKPGRHLGFGSGIHHCLGAPLARREMWWGFRALIDRVDEMWFVEGENDFTVQPNFALRALKELHIGFRKR